MLRKCTDEDISDEECKKVIDPFYENYESYLEEYVMPEIIAYYIANAFYRNSMYSGTFNQHYNFAKDMLNLFNEDYKIVKTKVFELLKISYIYSFKN